MLEELSRIAKAAPQIITLTSHAKRMKKASLQLWNYCVHCRQGTQQSEVWIVKCKEFVDMLTL